MPVMEPPVMVTAFEFCVEIVPRPRLVRAVGASLAPVPPSAIARSVMPVMEPPVMVTAFEFCVEIVPRPRLVRAPAAVLDPVPPERIGRAVASVSDVRCVATSLTFVPSLNTHMVLPVGTAMPVPVTFLTVIVPSVALLMIYGFSIAGTMRLNPAVAVPVRLRRTLRAA